MKNKQLIEILKGFNPEADVSLTTCEEIVVSYVCTNGATKETTKQIFIEEENTCESCFFHDGGGYCYAYKKRIEDVEECYKYTEE